MTSSAPSAPSAPAKQSAVAPNPLATINAAVGGLSTTTAHFAGGVMFLFLFICIVAVVVYKSNLQNSNDDYMTALYPTMAPLESINESDEKFSFLLRDYYIKTAYNCCSSGDYSGDYVSTNALAEVIRQGVRCLDFEIYSVGGVPVVSSSSQAEYTMKETYNSVPLSTAFDVINSNAFTGQPKCPNQSDPLILCLRIKSNNILAFNEIAKLIEAKLASRLLDSRYGYGYHGDNLGQVRLTSLMNKVIIMIDETPGSNMKPNLVYKKTALYEYANIIIRGPTSKKTFAEVAAPTPSLSDLIERSKKMLMYVVPERSSKPENVYDAANAHMTAGCQFVAMSYQSDDAPIQAYNKKFQEAKTAFILKAPELRYTPLTIEPPTPANPYNALTAKKAGRRPGGGVVQL
jgi:hypothetical protein